MMATNQNHSIATLTALRRSSILRNSARSSRRALPLLSNRSVGNTSGRSARSTTLTDAVYSLLQEITSR